MEKAESVEELSIIGGSPPGFDQKIVTYSDNYLQLQSDSKDQHHIIKDASSPITQSNIL